MLAAPLLVRIRPAARTERTVTVSYSCSASDIALVSALITLAVCRRRQDPRRRQAPGYAP